MTVVVMTGTTSLVRGTAYMMNLKGITYPGLDIQPWLSQADITHISNEVSFYGGCPPQAIADAASSETHAQMAIRIDVRPIAGIADASSPGSLP